jgi:hypothetical protein
MRLPAVAVLACWACSTSGEDATRPPPSPMPAPATPSTHPAAPAPTSPAPAPAPVATPSPAVPAPASGSDIPGTHLDDDALPHVRPTPLAPPHVAGRPIDVTLRSTPPGARATVDGVPIGLTPTFWTGDANGKEHEFTFVLDGRQANGQRYAVARYRFVPVTSGIIHVKLEPLPAGEPARAAAD